MQPRGFFIVIRTNLNFNLSSMRAMLRLFALMIVLFPLVGKSQDTIHQLETRPGQITFLLPPLSTAGPDVGEYIFGISLNPFIGYTGGVEGVELGGFLNINRYSMRGFQASGFMNITGTEKGMDTLNYSAGLQSAGFMNIVSGDFTGLQASGFGNIVSGASTGVAAAGFMNVSEVSDRSIQLAGFGNFSPEGLCFAQGSGFINIGDRIHGLQTAGFINIANEVKGVQTAGFANIAPEGMAYFQSAGFLNIGKDVKGVQAAGFANVARGTVTGVQASGFINVCDSLYGVQLGLINIVKKNGYRRFVISTNDYSPLRVSYRMGTNYLYTIYTVSKLMDENNRWAVGGGFGTLQPINDRFLFDIELTANQELWVGESRAPYFLAMDRLNMVNTLKAGFNLSLHEHLTISAGPSLNFSIANRRYNEDELGSNITPYWADSKFQADQSGQHTWLGFWPGFEVAIVF